MRNQYQIGQKADRLAGHADELFLTGKIDQAAYDDIMANIHAWADEQCRLAAAQRRAS